MREMNGMASKQNNGTKQVERTQQNKQTKTIKK
jgi:hypothetical protein